MSTMSQHLDEATVSRFWSKVDRRGPNECWEWQAGKDWDGYGSFSILRKSFRAHRIAWELASGKKLPGEAVILHVCDNPSCCNPAHLVPGTTADNARDASSKGRIVGPRGEKQWHSKLTEADVLEIRRLYATGQHTQDAIAKRFGVGRRAIGRVITGERWGWLDAGEKQKNCVRRGSSSGAAKITESDVLEIRRLRASGQYTNVQIGKMFGIADNTVCSIVTGATWSWLKVEE